MSPNGKEQRYTPYIAGLFDGGGSIYFRISQSNRDLGYRITPTIILHVGKSDALYGMIDEILVDEHIQFKLSKTESGDRRIEIDTRSNVERFLKLVEDYTVQHLPETRFIIEDLFSARDSGDILDEYTFLTMVKTIELMQPRRQSNDGVKYTVEYFRDEWDITDKVPTRDITLPDGVDTDIDEYLAGLFDGAGKIRPVVHEADSTELGYSISIRASITRSWLRDSTVETIEDFLMEHDIDYNTNKQGRRLSVQITRQKSINEFLIILHPLLVSNFEISALTINKIIPAINDQYHRTRQGLHDIVALFGYVIETSSSHRKYTADFFLNKWDDVEPLDLQKEPTTN